MLKQRLFPLAEILKVLLEIGRSGADGPVEIEFAVTLASQQAARPSSASCSCVRWRWPVKAVAIDLGEMDAADLLCCRATACSATAASRSTTRSSSTTTGSSADRSRDVARDVARFNARLSAAGVPYRADRGGPLGIGRSVPGHSRGVGRNPGARAIVEAGFRDFRVTPSQGTHFFQNLDRPSTSATSRSTRQPEKACSTGTGRCPAGRRGDRVRTTPALQSARRGRRGRPHPAWRHSEAARVKAHGRG